MNYNDNTKVNIDSMGNVTNEHGNKIGEVTTCTWKIGETNMGQVKHDMVQTNSWIDLSNVLPQSDDSNNLNSSINANSSSYTDDDTSNFDSERTYLPAMIAFGVVFILIFSKVSSESYLSTSFEGGAVLAILSAVIALAIVFSFFST